MHDTHVTVIAEVGVNHDGSMERARELVRAAADTGADAVKFQTFRGSSVVRADAAKARYQLRTTAASESQLQMLVRLELSFDDQVELREQCRGAGVEFLSTPFDVASLHSLVELGVSTLKLSSGDLTNEILLREAGRTSCRLILSTGMATLGEVEWALGVVASERTGIADPTEALATATGRGDFGEHVTILHCTTEYPAPPVEVNLRAMETLRRAFGLPVGYSDHTVGLAIPIAAVALGATVIEKHFTLDRTLPGPDHEASTEPDEFRRMVEEIRMVEQALGAGHKLPTASEWENRRRVRRSLVARTAIRAGEAFTTENLDAKRPADGVPASRYGEFLGRIARRDYEPDQPIDA
jgi:2,4-diacetamido-2,4,6-trideoxy-beta-L-gulose transferase